MVVLDDFAGPLVLVVAGLAVVLVVLDAFAPVVLVELAALPDAAFGFFAVVVVVETFALELVVLVVLAAVAAPAFRVVVVVGLAPLGGGTVQVRRREPS